MISIECRRLTEGDLARDPLYRGTRPKLQSCGGYLVEAIRQGCELHHPDEESEMLTAIWGMLGEDGRDGYYRTGLKLLAAGDELVESSPDPPAWPTVMRAVMRFVVCQNIDKEGNCPPGPDAG